jgi:hypothetical protein
MPGVVLGLESVMNPAYGTYKKGLKYLSEICSGSVCDVKNRSPMIAALRRSSTMGSTLAPRRAGT